MKTYSVIAVSLSCLFFSCKKQNIACTGNCYSLNVNGKVVNSLTNTVVADVPFIINQWRYTVSRRTVDKLSYLIFLQKSGPQKEILTVFIQQLWIQSNV